MGVFSSRFEPSRDLADLHGKVAIVTGGNAGIGFWTVVHLSRRGAKVYMAARNGTKASAAIERIASLGKDAQDMGEVVWLSLNLDDPREAKRSAELFLTKEERLDILVNNAGIMASPYEKTKDGVLNTMVINHMSPFVFVDTLSPLLEKTAREPGNDVRIVNVASTAHSFVTHSDFGSLEGFNETYESEYFADMKRYGKSKLANIIWTKQLQQRFDAKDVPVTCIALHPGGVHTDTVLESFQKIPLGWLVRYITRPFSVLPEEGSYTTLFAAGSPLVSQQPGVFRGSYIVPYGKVAVPTALARDPQLAETLWQTTEQIVRDIYKM